MKYNYSITSIFFISFIVLLSSCYQNDNNLKIPTVTIGFKPVYVDSSSINDVIFSTSPKILVKPGKIYKYGNMLLISDEDKGIHVIDNTDKTNPVKMAFINIPGNRDIARKGNFLYADCNGNIITIDISDPLNSKVTNISNSISLNALRPPNDLVMKHFSGYERVFYECADEKKGYLLSWEKDTIYKPECYVGYSNTAE